MEIFITLFLLTGSIFIIYSFLFLLEKTGRLDKLQRSIYLANNYIKFIEELKRIKNQPLNPPFDKIDLREVVTDISMASSRGRESLDKEYIKEGQISEL